MLSHLMVVLDGAATSFCHDHNPRFGDDRAETMSLEILGQVVAYAEKHELACNLLYGHRLLSSAHERLIEQMACVRIVPASLAGHFPDAVVVLTVDEADSTKLLPSDAERNVILRATCQELSRLPRVLARLTGKFRRVTVVIADLDVCTDAELAEYPRVLEALAEQVRGRYLLGHSEEYSVLSDRLMLSEMRNCGAGVDHVTVGPDGRFYLCPAFCYEGDQEYVDGALPEEPVYRNRRLLTLQAAPICRRCDAYHCRRCLALNRRTTLEINTPSREQCTMAHLEREGSRLLRERLVGDDEAFSALRTITKLNVVDPFESLLQGETLSRRVTFPMQPAEQPRDWAADGELLALLREVQRTQAEILSRLDALEKKS